MRGPYTHVASPPVDGVQTCTRCGLLIARRSPKPAGVLVIAVGDGRWRAVDAQTHHRPMCPLEGEPRSPLVAV